MDTLETITIFDGDDWVVIYDPEGDCIWADHPEGFMRRTYESMGFDVTVYEVSGYEPGFGQSILNNPPPTLEGAYKLAREMSFTLEE